MSDAFIPFHRPSIGPAERRAVDAVLESGWLTTGITILVLAALFGLMARSAGEPARWTDDSKQAIELVHGRFVRRILPWAVGFVPAVGLAVVGGLAWDEGSRGAALGCAGGCAVFGLGGWFLGREAAHRVLVDRGGLSLLVGDRPKAHLPWSEVREVRYSGFWGALVFLGRDRQTVRVSTFLRGFDLLTNLLPEFLERTRFEHALRRLATARRAFGG